MESACTAGYRKHLR